MTTESEGTAIETGLSEVFFRISSKSSSSSRDQNVNSRQTRRSTSADSARQVVPPLWCAHQPLMHLQRTSELSAIQQRS
jgi:hypothetical protein